MTSWIAGWWEGVACGLIVGVVLGFALRTLV
jgi:uncharacterized membrane-anchored protein YhcB (DUF1043 family)